MNIGDQVILVWPEANQHGVIRGFDGGEIIIDIDEAPDQDGFMFWFNDNPHTEYPGAWFEINGGEPCYLIVDGYRGIKCKCGRGGVVQPGTGTCFDCVVEVDRNDTPRVRLLLSPWQCSWLLEIAMHDARETGNDLPEGYEDVIKQLEEGAA